MYNVSMEHAGRYVCYTHNTYGTSTSEVWLTVLPGMSREMSFGRHVVTGGWVMGVVM